MPKPNNPTSKSKSKSKSPSHAADRPSGEAPDLADEKMRQVQALAAGMPHNANKAAEHGFSNSLAPQRGSTVEPASRLPSGSTLTEQNSSEKTGSTASEGINATIEPLDRVRVDSSGRVLTTNQGVSIS